MTGGYDTSSESRKVPMRIKSKPLPGSDKERAAAKSISERIQSGEVKILSAMTFWRDPKRKPKEPFHIYKRSMKNFNRARKARLRGGPGASLLLDKSTLRIIW